MWPSHFSSRFNVAQFLSALETCSETSSGQSDFLMQIGVACHFYAGNSRFGQFTGTLTEVFPHFTQALLVNITTVPSRQFSHLPSYLMELGTAFETL
jgi:hypothetical protein